MVPSDLYQVCKSIHMQQHLLWAHLAALKLLSKSSLWQQRHSHQSSPTSCACHTNGPRWMLYTCTTLRRPRTLHRQFVSGRPASTVIFSQRAQKRFRGAAYLPEAKLQGHPAVNGICVSTYLKALPR